MAVRWRPHCYARQAQRWLSPTSSSVCEVLQTFPVLCPILQSFWSYRLHGDSFAGFVVDSGLLCDHDFRVQHWRRGTVVARLCSASTGTRVWEDDVGCAWHLLVRIPPIHAANIVGHSPHVNLRGGASLCCATHQEHSARHRRTQRRSFAV